MLYNLLAEMARNRLSMKDIEKAADISPRTCWDKVHGVTDFSVDQALRIRNTLFSNCTIQYLFEKSEEEK